MGADGSSGAGVNIYYPTASWGSGVQTYTFTLTAIEDAVTKTKTMTHNFKNYKFWGVDPNETLTGDDNTETGDGFVLGLDNGSITTFVSTSYAMSTVTGINTSGAEYIHYLYPARISGTPVFWLNGLETGFTLVSSTLTVENQSDYSEQYKHYRSPNAYTDAVNLTLEVT